MKTAFLFPGQGAQTIGMGKDIYDKYEEAKKIYEKAEEISGVEIRKICFEGPEEELIKTENAQLAILTTSLAILKILEEKGIFQSMSRKGNCLDNSPMENFFGKMKNEMFYGFENTFESLDNLKQAMIDYIHYHNNFRITVKGKGLTPLQIRNQALSLS